MLSAYLLAAGLVLALQGPTARVQRERIRGSVKTTAGEAWRDARVFLVSAVLPELPRAAGTDVVEVRSDGRGRFVAPVLAGRTYSVWARNDPSGDLFRCTRAADNVPSGTVVTLEETAAPHRVLAVRLTGRERWADREPLRFRVVTTTRSPLAADVVPDAGGKARLPPLPGPACLWEAFGKDGSKIMVRELSLPRAGGGKEAKPAEVELALPPRFPFLVEVVARTGGKPVAGARFYQRISYVGSRNHWMFAGASGDDGFAELRVIPYQDQPMQQGQQHVFLYVQGEACARQQFGRPVMLDDSRDIAKLHAAKKPDFRLQVATETCRLSGRVLVTKGRPAARCSLLLYPSLGSKGGRAFYLNLEPELLRTDGEGRFTTGGWGPRFAYRLCVVPDAAVRARLGAPEDYPLAPILVAAVGVAEGETELPDIVLDELAPVDLSVSRADGFPAAGAEIALAEAARPIEFRNAAGTAERITLNVYRAARMNVARRGKLRLLLPDKKAMQVVVVAGEAWGFDSLAPLDGTRREVRLGTPATLTGRVLSGSGKPVAGARVQANPMRYPRGFDTRLANLVTSRFVRTDAAGRFRIGVPFKQTTYYVFSRIRIGATWYNTRIQNLADVDEDGSGVDPLELHLPVPETKLGK